MTVQPFLARQNTEGTLFADRGAYLAAKADRGVRPARFCHAMDRVSSALGNPYKNRGFPWMTLVLGSGCLETRESATGTPVSALPGEVARLLADRPELPDGSLRDELARDFAISLIEDRLDAHPNPGRGAPTIDPPQSTVTTATAELLLLTALLTRAFHSARAARPMATTRSGEDVAQLDPSLRLSDEVITASITPARELIRNLRTSAQEDGPWLPQLLADLAVALDSTDPGPQLRYAHLQTLTELCWYMLTQHTLVYPGWSDLLVRLWAEDSAPQLDGGRPRPAFRSIAEGSRAIERRYRAATRDSWNSRAEAAGSDRERFYEAAARVVLEQARVRGTLPKTVRPPLASIFLTTFDLELEMAMWTASSDPFVLAVPVNLVRTSSRGAAVDEQVASTLWLGCVVQPEPGVPHADQLELLLHPPAERWFVLSSYGRYAEDHGDKPTVVRLNGCPLVELPPLVGEAGWTPIAEDVFRLFRMAMPTAPEPGIRAPLELQHAVLLDEYAAMQQSAAEFFNHRGETTDDGLRYGLPVGLTGVPEARGSAFARFWTVIGVQVGDNGVRYRFASQLTAPRLAVPQADRAPERAGVAVNRRIDPAVRELLYWYAFDVVRARCDDFAADLEHYVEHLRSSQIKTPWDQECSLP